MYSRASEVEQTVKDLNLDEMFEVFEAADATISSSAIPKGLLSSEFNAKEAAGVASPLGKISLYSISNTFT